MSIAGVIAFDVEEDRPLTLRNGDLVSDTVHIRCCGTLSLEDEFGDVESVNVGAERMVFIERSRDADRLIRDGRRRAVFDMLAQASKFIAEESDE